MRLANLDLQHFGQRDQTGPVVGRKVTMDLGENAFAIRVIMCGKVLEKIAGQRPTVGGVIDQQRPAGREDDLRLLLNNRFACAAQLYTLSYMGNSQHTRVQPLYLRDGKYTSFRLEPMFFHALRMIAYRRGLSMSALIREVEGYPRERDRSFASVLRCFVVEEMTPHYPLTASPPPHAS